MKAEPAWLSLADQAAIKATFEAAAAATKATGLKHHVDHVYPLNGKTSCGLHVPWNLAVIPHGWNVSKNNAMPIEGLDVAEFEPVDVLANWHNPNWRLRP